MISLYFLRVKTSIQPTTVGRYKVNIILINDFVTIHNSRLVQSKDTNKNYNSLCILSSTFLVRL
jgi:hypothetical protein